MNKDILEIDQALSLGKKLPYALIRTLSRVTLGPTRTVLEKLKDPDELKDSDKVEDQDRLIEARFFDSKQEVRIFRGETELKAVRIWEGEDDTVIERIYRLANSSLFGRSITVRQILDFDEEDGQAYVLCTRLADWKGGC